MQTESYVYKKEVDWSLFNYGFAIPLEYQVIFKQVADRFIERGESKIVHLYLNGQSYEAKLNNNNIAERFGDRQDSRVTNGNRFCSHGNCIRPVKAWERKHAMGRKSFGAKPCSYPQPVWIIATYDENGTPDAMNAAWGGISEEKEISVCLSPGHKTCANFEKTGAFTVSMADAEHVAGCDYVGIVSGNKTTDKFSRAGFTATKSELVNAPIINELAVCMECRVISFDKDSCILKGEIVNVSVDETALTNGKVDVAKVRPIAFDPFNHAYHVLGEKVGDAWGSGKCLL